MLTLSPETFARMSAVEEQRFVERVVAFLRENVPQMASEPPDAMAAQVRALKAEAATYDMTSEAAVATYALTAALIGADFAERFPGARKILFSANGEDKKAQLLEGFVVTLLQKLKG
jgi:hypothetical protein